MATGGRKPKPIELHRRNGNPSKNAKPPAMVIAGRPTGRNKLTMPSHLTGHARDLWEWAIESTAEVGMLDRVDELALTMMCEQWGRAADARDALLAELTIEDQLEARLEEIRTMANVSRKQIARRIRKREGWGEEEPDETVPDISPNEVVALARLEIQVHNLETYGRLRRRVPVALGSMGQVVDHPLVQMERNAQLTVLRFATEYGLTASARARLGLTVLQGRSLQQELSDQIGPSRRAQIEE